MHKALLLTLLLSTLLCTCGRAQLTVTFTDGADETLNEAGKTYLTSTISARLADYERLLGSVIDERTGKIDQAVAAKLTALFIPNNERVQNDLIEGKDGELIGLPTYLSIVEAYFLLDGLSFNLNSARITEVIADEDNKLFQVDVRVNKSSESYYVPGGRVEKAELSRILKFSFRVPAGNPQGALIKSIGPPAANITAPYVRYAGVDLGFGGGGDLTGTRDEVAGNTGNDLSFGVSLLTNAFSPAASEGKNLFLAAGLGVYNRQVEGSLTGFNATPGGGEEFSVRDERGLVSGAAVQRTATNVNATETQTTTGLRIAVGPAYRVYDKKGTSAFVSVQYAPNVPLSTSGALDGTGNYHLLGSGPLDFNTEDITVTEAFRNDFGVGNEQVFSSVPELEHKIAHGLLLGLSFLKDLNAGSSAYGIGLSLEHYLPLTTAWEFTGTPGPAPFLDRNYPDETRNGPLGLYTEDVKLGYTGIKLRIYLKSSRLAYSR